MNEKFTPPVPMPGVTTIIEQDTALSLCDRFESSSEEEKKLFYQELLRTRDEGDFFEGIENPTFEDFLSIVKDIITGIRLDPIGFYLLE